MPTATTPSQLTALDNWVSSKERLADLKPDNQARIVWRDPEVPCRTDYAMVYLHGFTASQGEGEPQHRRLAQTFGCNLYLTRLPGHGLTADDAMQGITAQQWTNAAIEALTIGQLLGEKVILVGTSMGAALAIQLAAKRPEAIAAILAWSPAIRPYDEKGLQTLCNRNDIVVFNPQSRSTEQLRYWSSAVHSDAYRSLAEFLGDAMQPRTFAQVYAPFFLAYYYDDEQHQDQTASVPAMLAMYENLGTPASFKRKQAFPNGTHVIAFPPLSAAAEQVYQATCSFLEQVVGLKATQCSSPPLHEEYE